MSAAFGGMHATVFQPLRGDGRVGGRDATLAESNTRVSSCRAATSMVTASCGDATGCEPCLPSPSSPSRSVPGQRPSVGDASLPRIGHAFARKNPTATKPAACTRYVECNLAEPVEEAGCSVSGFCDAFRRALGTSGRRRPGRTVPSMRPRPRAVVMASAIRERSATMAGSTGASGIAGPIARAW